MDDLQIAMVQQSLMLGGLIFGILGGLLCIFGMIFPLMLSTQLIVGALILSISIVSSIYKYCELDTARENNMIARDFEQKIANDKIQAKKDRNDAKIQAKKEIAAANRANREEQL